MQALLEKSRLFVSIRVKPRCYNKGIRTGWESWSWTMIRLIVPGRTIHSKPSIWFPGNKYTERGCTPFPTPRMSESWKTPPKSSYPLNKYWLVKHNALDTVPDIRDKVTSKVQQKLKPLFLGRRHCVMWKTGISELPNILMVMIAEKTIHPGR